MRAHTLQLFVHSLRWQKLLCVVLMLLLLAIAAQSVRLGIAGVIVQLGQHEMDAWSTPPRPQGMREIDRVARYFTDSLEYLPDNPWALESLGALDLARMRLSRIPRQAQAYTWAAQLRFRLALKQRPASALLWANLSLSKLYLDEIDPVFFDALRNADELGPWEPASQQTVLFVGLAAWDRLDPAFKKLIVGVVDRGGVRNAEKVYEIVKMFGRFDLVCGVKGYHSVSASDCRARAGAVVPGASSSKDARQ